MDDDSDIVDYDGECGVLYTCIVCNMVFIDLDYRCKMCEVCYCSDKCLRTDSNHNDICDKDHLVMCRNMMKLVDNNECGDNLALHPTIIAGLTIISRHVLVMYIADIVRNMRVFMILLDMNASVIRCRYYYAKVAMELIIVSVNTCRCICAMREIDLLRVADYVWLSG